MYGPLPNERFPVPAVDLRKIDPEWWRQEVADPTGEQPGTIVVNTGERHLYYVLEGGRAIRYGVGSGVKDFRGLAAPRSGRQGRVAGVDAAARDAGAAT